MRATLFQGARRLGPRARLRLPVIHKGGRYHFGSRNVKNRRFPSRTEREKGQMDTSFSFAPSSAVKAARGSSIALARGTSAPPPIRTESQNALPPPPVTPVATASARNDALGQNAERLATLEAAVADMQRGRANPAATAGGPAPGLRMPPRTYPVEYLMDPLPQGSGPAGIAGVPPRSTRYEQPAGPPSDQAGSAVHPRDAQLRLEAEELDREDVAHALAVRRAEISSPCPV